MSDPSYHAMTAPSERDELAELRAERDWLGARAAEFAKKVDADRAELQRVTLERDELRADLQRIALERDEFRRHLSPPPSSSTSSEVSPAAVKSRPDLIPPEALLEAGRCLADRVDRDTALGPWFDRAPLAETIPKYRESLLRHVLAYLAGEHTDPQSRRPALAHAIVNASVLYRLEFRAITIRKG